MKTAAQSRGKQFGKHPALPCTSAGAPVGATPAEPAAVRNQGVLPMLPSGPDPGHAIPRDPTRNPAMTGRAVSESVVARSCAWCGREMVITQHTGRPRRYCCKSCRNRASEARTTAPRLAMQIAAGRLATGPVRKVVERTVTEQVTPTDAHAWTTVLGELARQLADPTSRTSREHWHHRRILTALADATAALDRAHPGGLSREPRR